MAAGSAREAVATATAAVGTATAGLMAAGLVAEISHIASYLSPCGGSAKEDNDR